MIFTNFEKEIMNKLNNKEILNVYDVLTLLNERYNLKIVICEDDLNNPYLKIKGKYYFISFEQEKKIADDLNIIFNIVELLNRYGMLNMAEYPQFGYNGSYLIKRNENNKHDLQRAEIIDSIIKPYMEKRIIVNEKLDEFIRDNYKTKEEKELEDERRQRKNAEKLTRIIAIISIIASLVTWLIGILTYSNVREIYIKNDNLIEKPLPVIIENLDEVLNKIGSNNKTVIEDE